MRVRVCPKCSKHNLENAFNCADCGTTLSIKTLIDTESNQLLSVRPLAGQTKLFEINKFYEQDVIKTLKSVDENYESIVWGYDLILAIQEGPLPERGFFDNLFEHQKRAPFLFGYFILTSERLFCVYFECKTDERGFPIRACLKEPVSQNNDPLDPSSSSYLELPIPAVDSPQSSLTAQELSSRKVVNYELNDLVSIRQFESTKDGFIRFMKLQFNADREVEFTFKIPETAREAYKYFSASLRK